MAHVDSSVCLSVKIILQDFASEENNLSMARWRPRATRRAAYFDRLVASVNDTFNEAAIPSVRCAPPGMNALGRHERQLRVALRHTKRYSPRRGVLLVFCSNPAAAWSSNCSSSRT
jgi:hypothetical protein